jgi:hypothetical protein
MVDLTGPFKLARAARTSLFRKRHPPVGAMSGTLVTQPDSPPLLIRLIHYGPETLEEQDIGHPDKLVGLLTRDGVSWVAVQGLGDETILRRIGETSSCIHWHWRMPSTFPSVPSPSRTRHNTSSSPGCSGWEKRPTSIPNS